MLHPRITKKLQAQLDALCSEHGVAMPGLEVAIMGGNILGYFYRPHTPEDRPTIFVFNPCQWTRKDTLTHEFTHYLDYVDGVRQGKGECHGGGFWDRLCEVEHLNG